MGRHYDKEEWLEFLYGVGASHSNYDEFPDEVLRLRDKFEEQVGDLYDTWQAAMNFETKNAIILHGYGGIAKAIQQGNAQAIRLIRTFTDRQRVLLDRAIHEGWAPKIKAIDAEGYPDLEDLAYRTFASIHGHGVGLWEGDFQPEYREFEKIATRDKKTVQLAHDLDMEAYPYSDNAED